MSTENEAYFEWTVNRKCQNDKCFQLTLCSIASAFCCVVIVQWKANRRNYGIRPFVHGTKRKLSHFNWRLQIDWYLLMLLVVACRQAFFFSSATEFGVYFFFPSHSVRTNDGFAEQKDARHQLIHTKQDKWCRWKCRRLFTFALNFILFFSFLLLCACVLFFSSRKKGARLRHRMENDEFILKLYSFRSSKLKSQFNFAFVSCSPLLVVTFVLLFHIFFFGVFVATKCWCRNA